MNWARNGQEIQAAAVAVDHAEVRGVLTMRALNGARVTASLLDVLADVAQDDLASLPLPDRARQLGERLGRTLAAACQAVGTPTAGSAVSPSAVPALIRPILAHLWPGSTLLNADGESLTIALPVASPLTTEPSVRSLLVMAALGSLGGHLTGQARTRTSLRVIEGASCQVLTICLAPQGVAAPDEDEFSRDGAPAVGGVAASPAAVPAVDALPEADQYLHQDRMQQLGEMAASVAHGLNNLLGAVAGQSSQMLDAAERDTPESPPAHQPVEGLRLIHQAALDGASLARRLLRTARGERIERADSLELVDLGQVLVDAVELTRSRWYDEARRIGVTIEPVIEIGQPLLIRGVPADLREIVVNLVLNAVDAMPAGGHLRLRGDVQHGSVVLTCEDEGVGMPPEVLDRACEPFFTTKGHNGTGMGLAIVYGVVARHGGKVQISSTVGAGTTLTLTLPAAELTHGASLKLTEAASASAAERSAAAAASLTRDLGGRSVLVVEDDPLFRAVFGRRLSLDADRVEAAGDARSALALLEAGHWDLVCVDEGLPDGTGRDLAFEIEQRSLGAAVILVTGSATRPDDPTLASPGVHAILPKPCSDTELAHAVRAALDSLAEALAATA